MNNSAEVKANLRSINTKSDDDRRSGTELTTMAFDYINSYKRHRALAESARNDGDMSKAIYNELKQYKQIDGLELALRAIQKEIRNQC